MREFDTLFGEIRGATSASPSPKTREAMCGHVMSALAIDSARATDELLPIVTGLADHRPDADRVLPALWLWQWMDGALEDPVVALARVPRIVGPSLSPQEFARAPELFDRMRATRRLHVSQTKVEEAGVWDGGAALERSAHLVLHEKSITGDLERWHQTSWMTQLTHFRWSFSGLPAPDLKGPLHVLPDALESLSLEHNPLATTPHQPHLQTMALGRHAPLHTDTTIAQSPNLRRPTKLTRRVQDPEHRRILHTSSTLSRGVRQEYA